MALLLVVHNKSGIFSNFSFCLHCWTVALCVHSLLLSKSTMSLDFVHQFLQDYGSQFWRNLIPAWGHTWCVSFLNPYSLGLRFKNSWPIFVIICSLKLWLFFVSSFLISFVVFGEMHIRGIVWKHLYSAISTGSPTFTPEWHVWIYNPRWGSYFMGVVWFK